MAVEKAETDFLVAIIICSVIVEERGIFLEYYRLAKKMGFLWTLGQMNCIKPIVDRKAQDSWKVFH